MHGVIVITAEAGRASRHRDMPVSTTAVLDCSGGFCAGDRVYVVTRGKDGGQSVVAVGVIGIDACTLHSRQHAHAGSDNNDLIVIKDSDLQWLWPPST